MPEYSGHAAKLPYVGCAYAPIRLFAEVGYWRELAVYRMSLHTGCSHQRSLCMGVVDRKVWLVCTTRCMLLVHSTAARMRMSVHSTHSHLSGCI
jgi:hypothetical protein